ncbi:hypothetical protein AB0E62_25335 [Streptomyces sp. NPDC038707]|uniref:hypothetical protein n=1 Tax=unclassified Streptomyces TaxID=2593676 RepID=UPI0033DD692A
MITSAPWTGMGGFPWQDARFAEYRTYGPGAAQGPGRPRLSDADARSHTVAGCLRGTDGRAPFARR